MSRFDQATNTFLDNNNSSLIFGAVARKVSTDLKCDEKEAKLLLHAITLVSAFKAFAVGPSQLSPEQKRAMGYPQLDMLLTLLIDKQYKKLSDELADSIKKGPSDNLKECLPIIQRVLKK